MTIYQILDKYADQQGWNTESKLGLALSFIAENVETSDWEKFLKRQADDEYLDNIQRAIES